MTAFMALGSSAVNVTGVFWDHFTLKFKLLQFK